MEEFGLDVDDIEYFEVYGIGIVIGDVVEVKFVSKIYCSKVFGNSWVFCIGFVKLNLNYIELVLGLVGFIKVVLMFKNKIFVFIINIIILNFKLKFLEKGIRV